MKVRANRTIVALLVWSVLGGFRAHAQPKYSVTELGPINSVALGINNSGQATGVFPVGNVNHGFRTAPNSPLNPAADDIGALTSGSPQTEGHGINSAGQVVGFGFAAINGSFAYRGFRSTPNGQPVVLTDLGTLGGPVSFGYGINQSGQAVGGAWLAGDQFHAFRTAPNVPINPATDDLGVLAAAAGGEFSEARAINSSGQVAGSSSVVDGAHAFRSTPNGQPVALTDLGTLGGMFSEASGINDSGVVVGASDSPGGRRAFRTAANSVINPATDNLGVLDNTAPASAAFGVNNAGQVVGSSQVGQELHAFLHTGGVMYDLNKLIPAGSGWELEIGYAINGAGQIVGWGIHDSAVHAFRLDPGQPYSAAIQQPINADGSSVFSGSRGVIPVKFKLYLNGVPTCQMPPATISLVRTDIDALPIDPNIYRTPSGNGSTYGVSDCQYTYNVGTSSLAPGVYRVDISFNGTFVGSAVFKLK